MSQVNAFLEAVRRQAETRPEVTAFVNDVGESIGYADLWDASDELACVVRQSCTTDEPIVVYGHKSPLMLVGFLACIKAGRAYVPTDTHVPAGRVANILSQTGGDCIIAVEPLPDLVRSDADGRVVLGRSTLETCLADARSKAGRHPDPAWQVTGEHTHYIIFTSGSTGAPKGVEITANDLANFMTWDDSLFADSPEPQVFMNQALLSFDLSVTELVAALTTGGTIFSLSSATESDLARRFSALARSGASCWVSTPTFVSVCLSDPSFSSELLPRLDRFFFCGETLGADVVDRLAERFPHARIINAYGPTESTVAVTAFVVEPGRYKDVLPVGRPRPGTTIRVRDSSTGEWLGEGREGELVICGDTVAKGYLGQPDKTAEAFGTTEVDGRSVRTYRTGDLGHVDADGMVWCAGRIDSQVKIHGFRIELGEVEAALQRRPGVELAVVMVRLRHGVPDHLVAHVQLDHGVPDDPYEWSLHTREALAHELPSYMIPRRIIPDEKLPVTPNGKVDRRRLLKTC